ncbi:MAG: hypothetical protein H7Y59_16795 [Anaerolineales bacterium]|nr:hypothetical protein [Anaerolineales bacterium]
MPRIKCHYLDCVFLDEGYCSAAAVEVDPDTGCATYTPTDGVAKKDEGWEEDETEDWDEEDGDEEDDDWLDDDEDEI